MRHDQTGNGACSVSLRTILSILSVSVAMAIASGCAKEQPATKEVSRQTPQAVSPGSAVVKEGEICDTVAQVVPAPRPEDPRKSATAGQALPKLVDLGKGTCIPCKKMAPILEELAREYEGRAIVEVIDLRSSPQAATEYGIKLIPTQVFFDNRGVEVWRHEGFLAKDQIVAKFAELGVKPK